MVDNISTRLHGIPFLKAEISRKKIVVVYIFHVNVDFLSVSEKIKLSEQMISKLNVDLL